jgi:integrase
MHHRRVLQIRGRRRTPGALPGRQRPPTAARLRVARDRAGPQRARRPAGRCRARPPAEHALISLLALNGLRVSEADGADIEQRGLERGHRALTITRKGGKVVTIPLAPRTARAIDLAVGERTDGPVFLTADGRRLDRHGAGRIVRKAARRAGIAKAVTLTRCGTRSLPPR